MTLLVPAWYLRNLEMIEGGACQLQGERTELVGIALTMALSKFAAHIRSFTQTQVKPRTV